MTLALERVVVVGMEAELLGGSALADLDVELPARQREVT